MQTFWQDIRYGLRMLYKNRGFTSVALLALGLGIGANTAIFSVVNSVLLRPLPFREIRSVWSWSGKTISSAAARNAKWAAPPTLETFAIKAQSFDHVAALLGWQTYAHRRGRTRRPPGRSCLTRHVRDARSRSRRSAAASRRMKTEPGAAKVVMLSSCLWQRRFGSDPAIMGKSVTLSGESYTVIGVMPTKFQTFRS